MPWDYLNSESEEVKEAFSRIREAERALQKAMDNYRPSVLGERYLTGDEVCDYLHISPRTLQTLRDNYEYFGYGYIEHESQLIPSVPLVFYSFHLMIILGGYFILFFIVILILERKKLLEKFRWMLWICLWSIPLGYICLQTGWIVAEVGRQPWTIQDILPTYASISAIEVSAVQTTFWLFAIIFTVLLVAEVSILVKQIKKGFNPQPVKNK